MRARLAPAWLVVISCVFSATSQAAVSTKPELSFMHGVGQVIAGVLVELPKTVLEATLNGPPVVGTAVGLLAGTARALQTTVGGLVEMAAGFDPWQTKRR